MTGLLVVISGPGGVGKGTVVSKLLAIDERLTISRSWTTRDQRPGEADDAYTFVSENEFKEAIDREAFLEWDHHFGNYYGSPIPRRNDVRDLILEIDVNGASTIQRDHPDALMIFIDTPSIELQRERLLGRGDPVNKVDERLAGGAVERELAADLPFVYVVNDDVERCAREIAELIEQRRSKQHGSSGTS